MSSLSVSGLDLSFLLPCQVSEPSTVWCQIHFRMKSIFGASVRIQVIVTFLFFGSFESLKFICTLAHFLLIDRSRDFDRWIQPLWTCYTVLLGCQRWFARSLETQQDLLCWVLCNTIFKKKGKTNIRYKAIMSYQCILSFFTKQIKGQHFVAVHGFNSRWLTSSRHFPVTQKTCSATRKLSHSQWQTLVLSGVYRNDMSATHPVHIRNIFLPVNTHVWLSFVKLLTCFFFTVIWHRRQPLCRV